MDRDQQIGDELHAAAVAERADMIMRAREALEHRDGALIGGLLARGVDREIAGARLGAGARQRTVEQYDPDFGQRVAAALLGGDGQGAGLQRDQPLASGGDQPVRAADHVVERGLAGQRQDREIGLGHRLGRACRGLAAEFRQRRHAGGVDIAPHHAEAGLQEVRRHGRSHDAEPDHANGLAHRFVLSPCPRPRH